MITDEKRAFKRIRRKLTIKYKLHGVSGPGGGTSVSENISPGGVYFINLKRLEIGQLLDCRIKIPGIAQEGRWTARVVRCENTGDKMVNTYGIAAEFVKSFGDSGKNLEKILKASS
jgi:hypothetical protein